MTHIMILAGGTGGHVMPALAVATELLSRKVEISWIGSKSGLEARLVPKAGIQFDEINILGLRKSSMTRKLALPFMMVRAMVQTLRIIRKRKPDAILGMGGFAAGPGGIVGVALGLPLVLHEQNSIAGLTNKWLSRISRVVMSGFPVARGISRSVWSGNPVRASIMEIPEPALRLADRQGKSRILVIGGSQGARVFNQHLADLLHQAQIDGVEVWHQCGRQGESDIAKRYAALKIFCRVEEFIDDMDSAYAWSDIVICRAGAMTVSEICCAGTVAIFVPYPHAVNDHQAENADFLVRHKAALMVREQDFVKGEWLEDLKRIVSDRDTLVQMAQRARSLAKPDASRQVADACLEVLCVNS